MFFGDIGGNFYALKPPTARSCGVEKIGGAIGGGVITYSANGAPKVKWRQVMYLPPCRPKSGERKS